MEEKLGICPPSKAKLLLEKLHLREVIPADLCASDGQLTQLYHRYSTLAGDKSAIGSGDDGRCQSWRGHRGWWKTLVAKEGG